VAAAQTALEARLLAYSGNPVAVFRHSAAQMQQILVDNLFANQAGNFTVAVFLPAPPAHDAIMIAADVIDKQMRLGAQEIYIYYP
jgi:hypothetical protein